MFTHIVLFLKNAIDSLKLNVQDLFNDLKHDAKQSPVLFWTFVAATIFWIVLMAVVLF